MTSPCRSCSSVASFVLGSCSKVLSGAFPVMSLLSWIFSKMSTFMAGLE